MHYAGAGADAGENCDVINLVVDLSFENCVNFEAGVTLGFPQVNDNQVVDLCSALIQTDNLLAFLDPSQKLKVCVHHLLVDSPQAFEVELLYWEIHCWGQATLCACLDQENLGALVGAYFEYLEDVVV